MTARRDIARRSLPLLALAAAIASRCGGHDRPVARLRHDARPGPAQGRRRVHGEDLRARVRLPHRARTDPAATRAGHSERHRGHADRRSWIRLQQAGDHRRGPGRAALAQSAGHRRAARRPRRSIRPSPRRDPTPASDIDGPALLTRLGLKPTRVLGAVDTDEVAFLLTLRCGAGGTAAHDRCSRRPAARGHPPGAAGSRSRHCVYAASVTRLASRPNPQGFVAFLATPEATALLTEAGLELQT